MGSEDKMREMLNNLMRTARRGLEQASFPTGASDDWRFAIETINDLAEAGHPSAIKARAILYDEDPSCRFVFDALNY